MWPQTIPVFMRHRMRCVGCPARRFHTIADVCAVYATSQAAFIAEIRAAIE